MILKVVFLVNAIIGQPPNLVPEYQFAGLPRIGKNRSTLVKYSFAATHWAINRLYSDSLSSGVQPPTLLEC